MDKEINIEEFKIKWKDFLASNLYGDLSKEIRSLLTHIKELGEKLQKEIISVNELSFANQDLNQRVKELGEQHNLFPK